VSESHEPSDDVYNELADLIELVDEMTKERLAGGELERRRREIMDRVRCLPKENGVSGVHIEICPACSGNCHISVDLDTGMLAHLPDRYLALTSMRCRVTCTVCGHERDGTISDMDIAVNADKTKGQLAFGKIEFDQ
jgi:hypothetical protein